MNGLYVGSVIPSDRAAYYRRGWGTYRSARSIGARLHAHLSRHGQRSARRRPWRPIQLDNTPVQPNGRATLTPPPPRTPNRPDAALLHVRTEPTMPRLCQSEPAAALPVLTGHLTHALHAHTHTPLTHVHAYMHTTHIAMSISLLTFTPNELDMATPSSSWLHWILAGVREQHCLPHRVHHHCCRLL